MKISKGRRCSYSVPSLMMMSLMVTYMEWSETGVLILYVEPMSISGRCSSSVMRMTLALSFTGAGLAASAAFSSGLRTRYLTIFLSIFMPFISVRVARRGLVLAVVAFFQRVVEIGGGVLLAVVFD